MACGQDEVPSYYELLNGILKFSSKELHDVFLDVKEPKPEEKSWSYFNITFNDMIFTLILAAVFTVFRSLSTNYIFRPMAVKFGLTPTNQKKMPESAWKFVYYVSAWSFCLYILILSNKYCFFQQPSTLWDGWSVNSVIPFDVFLMYAIQCGFYTHSLYATVFLDVWRKDSVVMMIHHVLTLLLCWMSFSLRYHNCGILVLFLHDMCDIQLEFTKLNVYFKTQNGEHIRKHAILANITFFCFTLTWFISRLYWFPLKVIYTSTTTVLHMELDLPGAPFVNVLLLILQAMNIYWFLFILGFLYRVARGQVQEVDDTREYDVEEKFSQQLSAKLDSVSGTIRSEVSSKEHNNGVSSLKHTNGGTTQELRYRSRPQ